MVTIHYSLGAKCTQLWSLNEADEGVSLFPSKVQWKNIYVVVFNELTILFE